MQVIGVYVPGLATQPVARGAYLLAALTDGGSGRPGAGDWAVYIGIVHLADPTDEAERNRAAEWVAYNGSKQTLEKARAYFPNLTEEDYRR